MDLLHGAAVASIFRDRPDGTEVAQSHLGAIPIIKPPYAYLVAIDLSEGEIAWRAPLGEGSQIIRSHPLLQGVELPERLGTPGSNNGPMVTKGGWSSLGAGTRICMRSTRRPAKRSGGGRHPHSLANLTRKGRWCGRPVPSLLRR